MVLLKNEQIVVFSAGDRVFALELDRVESIIENTGLTPVPDAPVAAEGVVYYRDRVLPVISPLKLLKIDQKQTGELIVVVRGEVEDFGLSSDRIDGIVGADQVRFGYIPVDERENRFICGAGEYKGIEFSLLDFRDTGM